MRTSDGVSVGILLPRAGHRPMLPTGRGRLDSPCLAQKILDLVKWAKAKSMQYPRGGIRVIRLLVWRLLLASCLFLPSHLFAGKVRPEDTETCPDRTQSCPKHGKKSKATGDRKSTRLNSSH